jgi:molybdate ABC transporter permease protein
MMADLDLSPLWLSLKTAAVATVITFFWGLMTARWMLNYRGKARGLLDGLFTLPLVLPPTVVGFVLLVLFGRYGWLGMLLSKFGITVIFSWEATVIASTVVAFPLMYRTALGAFEQVNPNLLHAARTLGASENRVFWTVLLPLSIPGVAAGTILAFARALGEFGATLMLAGNIPGKTQTIPIAIFFVAEQGNEQQALFWVLIMVAIALTVIAALNYWSQKQRFPKHRTARQADLSVVPASHQPIQSDKRQIPDSVRFPQLEVQLYQPLNDFTLDVSFVANNQPLGLLGASGSGKSMTLRCIAGLDTPKQGRIVLNGRVLFDAQRGINLPSDRRRIGLLFQDYALFPHLTVAQNIAFGLQSLPKKQRSHRIQQQLVAMQLQGLGDRYPHQLSGGQQQRVALARALAIEPEALLLDEPFSALDSHLRSQLEQQLIHTLTNYPGITLFVSHNLEEAYRVCADLLVLSRGTAIAHGSKQAIFEQPRSVTVAQLTGCKNFSRAQVRSAQTIEAIDWNCTLEILEPIPPNLAYVGIRAHHIHFLEASYPLQSMHQDRLVNPSAEVEGRSQPPDRSNTFAGWLVQTSETPHRMTLYLKLNEPPTHAGDYHLQAEVFKEKWAVLKQHRCPWQIQLDPLRLMLMTQD